MTGSGYRAENRWASVGQGDPRPEEDPGERWRDRDFSGAGSEFDRTTGGWPDADPRGARTDERPGGAGPGGGTDWDHGTWSEPVPPALPVNGVPVSAEWRPPAQRGARSVGQWGAAEPEPARLSRHQRADEEQRYGYPPRDDTPRAGGARPADHWR
ncbi:hypothetical protein E1258_18420 [Micromonospora sp. KC207]|nr:hypothetical protein E1258_18420 [Micromonospora sp. KC207]